ncbi:unnamed protein product [Brassicogethes aeneus]|uniref:Suppressor of white apricot N-terminal domain-containing protein n=1 Tax=Brassicogethes aeneus TaxID=1431903 RepID=A0A9P0AVI2_BRAAE|nr:unnamed protein product [Brassicogethes aeneus]
MAQWNNDTGILRKNKQKENHEELLVFGFACKLFRDDERAQHIDQGKHLIPWMGDEKLKIDRLGLQSVKSSSAGRASLHRNGFRCQFAGCSASEQFQKIKTSSKNRSTSFWWESRTRGTRTTPPCPDSSANSA